MKEHYNHIIGEHSSNSNIQMITVHNNNIVII